MADFKVGDEVYVRGVIEGVTHVSGKLTMCRVMSPDAVMQVGVSRLIPASRVTIAPTRRAAEFPKDWNRKAFFSDDGVNWFIKKIVGYDDSGEPGDDTWLCSDYSLWAFCEVEE